MELLIISNPKKDYFRVLILICPLLCRPMAINYNSPLPTCPLDTGGPYTLIVSVWVAEATLLVAVRILPCLVDGVALGVGAAGVVVGGAVAVVVVGVVVVTVAVVVVCCCCH